jgi:hypothetical protein
MKKIIIVSYLFFGINFLVMSQESKHSFSTFIGYGVGQADKRYDFLYSEFPIGPIQTVITKSENTTLDDEYAFGVTYKYALLDRVKIGLGVGYAQLVQDFLLPANPEFFSVNIYPFFWRDQSRYHMMQWQPSIDIALIKKPYVIGINCTSVSNVSFRKHIRRFNLNRNKLEYFATEVYPGIFGEYKRFRWDLGYRYLHRKYRDDAIPNNGLNPDDYNSLKVRLLMSYRLK